MSTVHFIGIGGAGMSAIAKVMLERGVRISGSDLKRSRAAAMLEAMGASVQIGHDATNISGAMQVIVSSAIPDTNPELVAARSAGLPVLTRGQALADVLTGGRSIVVAGTHGKTTTTSMIVTILRASGVDPTYLVGAGLNDVGTNARSGRGELAVAESDESDGSFLLLEPSISVVTNVEPDHLDHWGSYEAMRAGFRSFLERTREIAVLPVEEGGLAAGLGGGVRVVTFGDGGDVWAQGGTPLAKGAAFTLCTGADREDVRMNVRGRHNIWNALAAAAACIQVGVPLDEIREGLERFRGVERRFQIRGEVAGVTVIDDYAHHPTEIAATLEAARPGPWRRLIAVFQPHRYSRTAALHGDFGAAFNEADRIVVTEVYGAGEQPVPGVTGKLVADAICERIPGRGVAFLPHREELLLYLRGNVRPGDAVLTLGAGDIHTVGEELLGSASEVP
jgi:UDP-N-acetylmuramate--alanine ligase